MEGEAPASLNLGRKTLVRPAAREIWGNEVFTIRKNSRVERGSWPHKMLSNAGLGVLTKGGL